MIDYTSKIEEKFRCIREYTESGSKHTFLIGDIITISSLTMTFLETHIGNERIIISWNHFDNHFITLKEHRNNTINELLK